MGAQQQHQQQQQQYAAQLAAQQQYEYQQLQQQQYLLAQQQQQFANALQQQQQTGPDMSKPLPKPMTIKDPKSGSVVNAATVDFKPREPAKPLAIINPNSGDKIS